MRKEDDMRLVGNYKSNTGTVHAIDDGSDTAYCGFKVDVKIKSYPHSSKTWITCGKCKKKIPEDVA